MGMAEKATVQLTGGGQSNEEQSPKQFEYVSEMFQ